jgi:hypothetical protein
MATAPATEAPPTEQPAAAPAPTGAGAPLRPTSTSPGAFIGSSMKSRSHARYLNALFYGRHGAGKSTLAGSAADVPEMADVLVITAEGGDVVFDNNPRIDNWENIDTVKVDRIEQFQKVTQWLENHIKFRDIDSDAARDNLRKLQDMAFPDVPDPERLRRYRTIVADSLTEIEAHNLTKILGLDAVGLDAGDELEVAGYPQFRKNLHMMQKIVRTYRDLPINFLAVCAETYAQDERKQFHYTPRLTGQLRDVLQGFFDVVGWLVPSAQQADAATGVSPRRLYVQPQTAPRADAKCRLATYKGAYFEDPVMEEIMKATGFLTGNCDQGSSK